MIDNFEDLKSYIDNEIRAARRVQVSTRNESLFTSAITTIGILQELRKKVFDEELPIERLDDVCVSNGSNRSN